MALLFIDHFLNISLLLQGATARSRNDTPHKLQRSVGGFRHLIGNFPAGVAVIAQQFSLTRPERHQTCDQLAGIVGIVFLRAQPARVEEIFSGLTIA